MARINLTIQFKTDQLNADKRVNIRGDITAGDLITTAQKQFSLDGLYELRLGNRLLDLAKPLDEQGVAEQGRLLFTPAQVKHSDTADLIARGVRHDFSVPKRRVFLSDDREGTEYDIQWHPAVLGRRDPRDPYRNQLLAVDLEEAADSMSVSRHHACIMEAAGEFYVEGLSDRNPTYVNDAPLRFGVKTLLHAGDRILMGRISLTFYVVD